MSTGASVRSMIACACLGLGVLGAARVAAAPASAPISSREFATGWQRHVQPVYLRGPTPRASGRDVWIVSRMAPPGHYVLIRRLGPDRAEVIPGHAFTIDPDPDEEIHLLLPPGLGEVEALPLADVPALAATHRPR